MIISTKRSLMAAAIALACANASATDFYTVVPVKGRTADSRISVRLNGFNLPSGLAGTPYSGFDFKPLLTVSGDKDYTGYGVKWSVASGNLPAGLTLNADGTLTGTPTGSGTSTFEVQATYKTRSGQTTYHVYVGAITVALAAAAPPEAVVGVNYNYDLKPLLTVEGDNAYTGSGVSWTVVSSTLPAGLVLRADGTISGTPTASGTGAVTARATYRGSKGEQTYQVVTQNITVTLAEATPPQALVGQVYNYDLNSLLSVSGDNAYNGSGVTWSVVSSTLPAGLYLRNDGSIVGTPTAAGTGTVTARATFKGIKGEQTYQVVTLNLAVALAAGTPPQAIIGQAYTYDLKQLLTVTGDSAYSGSGVTWTVVANSLPAGLYLRNDGSIVGTPTATGSGTVTARASYKGLNGEQTYQVVTLNVAVSLAASTPPQAIVGQAYTYDLKQLLTVTGDTAYAGAGVTWSVVSSTLPDGLTLRSDGTIGGTPTGSGSGSITARATYKGVNGEQTYQVVTLSVAVSLAAATPPQAMVGQAYNFDLKNLLTVSGDGAYDGSGVTWTVVANTLPAGLYLRNDGSIVGTPTAAGSGSVTARATYKGVKGEQAYQVVTLNVSVNLAAGTPPQAMVGQAYNYDLKSLLTVTGDSGYDGSAVTWTVVSSTLPNGLFLRTDGTIGGTPTTSGTGTVTARATYRGINGQQTYQVVTLNVSVALAPATPPQAQVGQAYNFDLKALLTVSGDSGYSGSGVTWTVVSSTLPAGLTLRTDGTIGGTPTASGTGTVTARATYRGNNGEQTYQVVTLNIGVSLAAATPPQAIVGQAYSYDLKPLVSVSGDSGYSGSGVTWSVVSGTLPTGLSLLADGTIAGTATSAATGTVTVRASYRGNNGQQSYQVVSLNITVALATATPPQAIVGQAYSYNLKTLLTVSGDSGYSGTGVTWSLASGTLPAGLSVLADGTIGGTPTAAGTGTVTVRATYRGNNGQQTYQVVSLNIVATLASATPPQAIVGQAYTYDLKPLLSVSGDASYTVSAVTWSLASGSLPAGLVLDSSGRITGTPTAATTVSPVVRATYRGVNGQQTYQVVSLNISVALTAATPPNATMNTAYSFDLKTKLTVAGDPSYSGSGVTWTVTSGGLPPGLSLNSSGVVAGTPSDAGSGTIQVRATYRNVSSALQSYSFVAVDPYTYTWKYSSWHTIYEDEYGDPIYYSCDWSDTYQAYRSRVSQERDVWCQRSDSVVVDDSKCTAARPSSGRVANVSCTP